MTESNSISENVRLEEGRAEGATVERSGPTIKRGKSDQVVGTPRAFLDAAERRFGSVAWDLAATTDNSVCRDSGSYFGPDHTRRDWRDALAMDWGALIGTTWCNPPFSNIAPWAAKAETTRHRIGWTLMLVPASVDAEWYWKHVHGKAFVMPLRGRLTFRGSSDPYPKGLLLAAYGFGVVGFEPWKWKHGVAT